MRMVKLNLLKTPVKMNKLTSRQKELINLAKSKGFLTLEDFNATYSSPISRKANIERLIALKLIKKVNGKFEYLNE